LTVKAFLKSEEKKRDKERGGSNVAKPGTPVPSVTPVTISAEQHVDTPDQPIQSIEMAAGQSETSYTPGKVTAEDKAINPEVQDVGSQAPEQQSAEVRRLIEKATIVY
jgi:zinc finger CCCH domain-containing protein 13